MHTVLEAANEAVKRREAVALCTVVRTTGSAPLKAGATMLVWQQGHALGTVGGGNVEKQVVEDAVKLIGEGNSTLREYPLLDLQMCCGGTMSIFIHTLKIRKRLIVFGAGHIGSRIIDFAEKLDFHVLAVDERAEITGKLNLPPSSIITLPHETSLPLLPFDRDTYIVICTHQHEYDREILAYCLGQPHAYLGMIGSRRKILVTRKRFLQQGICDEEQFDHADMPMGYNLGQNNPAEIAFGIVAKILAIANDTQSNLYENKKQYELHSDSNGCG
ncbi:MAG: XdhC family protein [Bacteroidia bacterium]|nr:XdhC family protein [Bacteroidia bacterium]